MSLAKIAEISRKYGSDERYVLAGGGNTSFKDNESLYIKASGFALATIEENGFVRMVRTRLDEIWSRDYPEDQDQREKVALKDLMDARAPGEESKRPSVETLLHEAIPQAYVVHTHPSLVNGLTCSAGGEVEAKRLFGGSVLWIPLVNPGYILARTVKDALDRYKESEGGLPDFILLQNHGVFISADSPDRIDELYDRLFNTLKAALDRTPDLAEPEYDTGRVDEISDRIAVALEGVFDGDAAVRFGTNNEILRLMADSKAFEPVSSAFTPDHIVYSGHAPLLLLPDASEDDISGIIKGYIEKEGVPPKSVCFPGLGVFGCGGTEKAALNAVLLFMDAAKVAAYTESFGGHRFMSADQIEFIRSWEVESYRSKISTQK